MQYPRSVINITLRFQQQYVIHKSATTTKVRPPWGRILRRLVRNRAQRPVR